jgi:hypothetical protein
MEATSSTASWKRGESTLGRQNSIADILVVSEMSVQGRRRQGVMSVGGAAQIPIKTSIVINFFSHLNKKEGFFRHLSDTPPQTHRLIK